MKHYIGYIELRDIWYGAPNLKTERRYFLIEVNTASHKIHATYGPFATLQGLREVATLHGITAISNESSLGCL